MDALNFEIKYSKQRKSIALYVHNDARVEVRAPVACDPYIISAFVEKKKEWIIQKLEIVQNKTKKLPQAINDGDVVYFLGNPYFIRLHGEHHSEVELSETELVLPNNQERAQRAKTLESWLREQAQNTFGERLEVCHKQITGWSIPKPDLVIRKMKRRWGSAHTDGHVTLNLMLIHYPQTCIDYVIYHELCHFKEFNHSPAFYTLLDELCPDWLERRDFLNRW